MSSGQDNQAYVYPPNGPKPMERYAKSTGEDPWFFKGSATEATARTGYQAGGSTKQGGSNPPPQGGQIQGGAK